MMNTGCPKNEASDYSIRQVLSEWVRLSTPEGIPLKAWMYSLRTCLLTLGILFISSGLNAGQSSLVTVDANNQLVYTPYANRGQANADNILPDFSHCGYGGGGVALPNLTATTVLYPVPGDNLPQIQAAIDALSAEAPDENGFRGVIHLSSGLYTVTNTIRIRANGIVLRGESARPANQGGTEILATRSEKHDAISIQGTSLATSGTPVSITDDFVGSGTHHVTVADPSVFSIGQRIIIQMRPNQAWVDHLGMAQYNWTADSYRLEYERIIADIRGNILEFHAPLVQPIEARFGGAVVFAFNPTGRVTHSGVEHLWIRSSYTSDTDEKHAWNAVRLTYVENCWVKNVTAQHFGYACVLFDKAYQSTVQDCAMLDPISTLSGGRRYSFHIDKGSFNLIQRCFANKGRHDTVTGSRVTGPNVFLDVLGTQSYNNSGPHHRHATGILFDRVILPGGELDVENRKDSGTGHGWAGSQIVFWNCLAARSTCDAPPGQMNFNIGFTGSPSEGNWAPEDPPGIWEALNDPIEEIPSLYLAQLKARLGETALHHVTTELQRAGKLESVLEEWGGQGPLPTLLPEDCPKGLSLFGNCRQVYNPTFFGTVMDIYLNPAFGGYLYRYDDASWYWVFKASSAQGLFLYSFLDQTYQWTSPSAYPYYWDFLNARWTLFQNVP